MTPHPLARLLLVLSLALGTGLHVSEAADPFNFTAQATPDRQTAVRNGVSLERAHRWIDAVQHYEKALESWPEDNDFKFGLRRSKIHFGIERRYSDRSFENGLVNKSRRDALILFDDILQKVRSNYVDVISNTSFVAHGTESLYLALSNDKFAQRNLSRASATQIARMRQILRDRYWNKPVSSQEEARRTVSEVCDLAESQIGLSSGAVVMEYLFGGCNSLDDYSNFLTPDRLEDLYGNIEGEFVGLGIEMKAETGKGLLLVNVLPESPASEGGMLAGEYIVSIDGADCREMTTDEAAKMLRGPSGSTVRLELQQPNTGRIRERAFARRAVVVRSIPVAEIIDQRNGVGYIQLAAFQKTSAQELDQALAKLERQGMRALIWDVRGNPGGLLTAAVEVLDRFIDDGVLVSTRGRSGDQNWSYSAHRSGTHNLPLVLLVDGDSASASEIVAGAVHDHQRGTIVGRQTYGKWSVQSIFPVRASTGMRLTTAKFYSPHGRTLGKIGVKPDVIVDLPEGQTQVRASTLEGLQNDLDIQRGLEVLRGQITQR